MIKLLGNRFKDLRNLRHAVCDLLLCFKEKNDEDGLSKNNVFKRIKSNGNDLYM